MENHFYHCSECDTYVLTEPRPHEVAYWDQTMGTWFYRTVRLCVSCCPRPVCGDFCEPQEATDE